MKRVMNHVVTWHVQWTCPCLISKTIVRDDVTSVMDMSMKMLHHITVCLQTIMTRNIYLLFSCETVAFIKLYLNKFDNIECHLWCCVTDHTWTCPTGQVLFNTTVFIILNALI